MDMPPLPEVQDQGTDPALTQQAATLRMEAPLEIEAHQSSINAAPAQKEKLRDVPLPTEAGEAFSRPSAACTWNWGQRAPSPSSTEMQDQVGSTSDAHQGEVLHLSELLCFFISDFLSHLTSLVTCSLTDEALCLYDTLTDDPYYTLNVLESACISSRERKRKGVQDESRKLEGRMISRPSGDGTPAKSERSGVGRDPRLLCLYLEVIAKSL
ncbi:hypothetical protein BJY52DRAFT_1230872 [Lactarius psammicola]|nr:hypothetical protein BJY52DRAFT_1230872 [Lactarius psammicola]